ncbi:hypothetical protein [Nocardia cyriacigeorgica]|uniref:hypothetical protein n=1 Tax=Nocardia cyriacigeorgica TaxID=135487 RepID=UPI0018951A52|nr:hypothetical protein [Nocardia cyriacigeorgica]MBF6452652.1 hypothetical protein [Nocardia cyriacigeorgica]MBF6482137.1 hypothetical protein [Nocardia cyriacigeorgica]MBF6549821.1 hypothetical protein [Nocardia cyriacigeorgica]
MVAELRRNGIPASYGGAPNISVPLPEAHRVDDRDRNHHPATGKTSPPTAAEPGTAAIIVLVDRSLIEFSFGDRTGSATVIRRLDRARRIRSIERQMRDMATNSALSIAARRLLIVCDAGRTSPAERAEAIRWVRGLAHRIGYECSINGLHGLGTWYTVVVPGTDIAHASRSVVEWYRKGHLPSTVRRR